MKTSNPQCENPKKVGDRGLKKRMVSRGIFGFRFSASWVVTLWIASVLHRSPAAETAPTSFRVGFSSAMFTDVNENDAKAAVKVWGQTIAKEHGIETDPEPKILKDLPALSKALGNDLVDAVGITILEYAQLCKDVRFAPILVAYNARRPTEQYVLLAHSESKIANLADLHRRSLAIHQNARLCLAQPWLDTLLVQNGLKPAGEWFGKITQNTKLSKTLLPVFFRQNDACLVTRSGFETMIELNPQVGKQLKVIASSPEMVQAVFAFRADYNPPFKAQLLAGLQNLNKTPAGQQVLTIFHSENIEEQPVSCLDTALELIATHARLCGGKSPSKVGNEGSLQAETKVGNQ